MEFNPIAPTLMHIDINSCFATIEQQANPRLRGKPVAVAAYTTPGGCILAASKEAKLLGIQTGMRVGEGKGLCPNLTVLSPDPDKYRYINKQFQLLLSSYTPDITVKSIDEMVVNFCESPVLFQHLYNHTDISSQSRSPLNYELGIRNFTIQEVKLAMKEIAMEIKQRIKDEIGEWLTVSIGVSTNRYLAKVASDLRKPDGLLVIDGDCIERLFTGLPVEALCGIKKGYGNRLRCLGITTSLAFYQASPPVLTRAFQSICGGQWWTRLHGWEADDREFETKTIGHSYALPVCYPTTHNSIRQILYQLVIKMGKRLRSHTYQAGGIHISCVFKDHGYWHRGMKQGKPLFTNSELFRAAISVLEKAPVKPVRILAVTSYLLTADSAFQLDLYANASQSRALTQAVDRIEDRWGACTVIPARMLRMENKVMDRIAFGGGKSLSSVESFVKGV